MDIAKIDPDVIDCLRKRGLSDSEIEAMTPEQAFSESRQWNGLIGFGAKLVNALDNLRAAA